MRMRRYYLFISVTLACGVLFFASAVLAQTSSSSPGYSRQISTTIIEELQKQIRLLQEQVADLTVQLEASKKEVTATKGELRSTQQEVKGIKEEIRFTRLLQRGVSGDEVKKLQEFLAQFPDIYPEARVTGYFGPKTEAAVKRLQEKQGIEVIGIVGPKTLAKLNELMSEGAGESGVSPPGLSRAPGLHRENAQGTLLVPGSPRPSPATTTASGIPSTPPVTPSGTTPAIPAEPGAQTGTTTVPAIPAVPTQSTTTVATSTEPVPTPVPPPSPAPTPAPTPTPTPTPTPSPAPSPSPTPTPTPSSGATSTPIISSTNSNNNSLLSFARIDTDRYVLSFSDPDGLHDIDIRKAGGSVFYSGHPFNCPTQLEAQSGGWLNFGFFPSDFPLTGSIVDCAHSGVAYPVQASLPPLPGPSPVSAQNSQVQGVSATVSADRAVLVSWTPVPIGVSVYGIYNIYRSATADFIPNAQTNLIAQVNSTVYQNAQVPDGVYYYKVALQDINGVVGLASVAVKAVVAINTVPPSITQISSSLLPAPTGSTVGGSMTTSGDTWQGQVEVYAMLVDFIYDPAVLSQVKSFRFYQKKPGDVNFNLVETFSDPGSVASCYAPSGIQNGNVWKLLYMCSTPSNLWRIQIKTRQPASYYATGDYEFYVAAVDSSGIESSPSPIFKIVVLQPTVAISPTQAQSPVSMPLKFEWTTGGSFADIYVYEDTYLTNFLSPIIWVKRSYGTSYIYDGPALNPAKKYVVRIQGQGYYAASAYITSLTQNIETFWVKDIAALNSKHSLQLAQILFSLSGLLDSLHQVLAR